MARYACTQIEYETGDEDVALPTAMVVEIDPDTPPDEAVPNAISDLTGWLVKAVTFKPAE